MRRNLLKVVLSKAANVKKPSDDLVGNVQALIALHFHDVYAHTQEEELEILGEEDDTGKLLLKTY